MTGRGAGDRDGGAEDVCCCATVIGKVVFKSGRITVAPESVLRASGLLPASDSQTWSRDMVEARRAQGLAIVAEMSGAPVATFRTAEVKVDARSTGSGQCQMCLDDW